MLEMKVIEMFKKIKYLLYKKGYLKLGPLEKKINYLLCHPEISKIHTVYYSLYIKTLEPDIIKHKELLKKLIELNISGDKLEYTVKTYNPILANWLTHDGIMLDSKDMDILEWLKLSKKIVIKTELLVGKVITGNEYHNFAILKNVYGDINNIVELLLEHLK